MGKLIIPGTVAHQAFSDEEQINDINGGHYDYAEIVSPVTGLVSAETGIEDLIVSITVPANPGRPTAKRRVRLEAWFPYWLNSGGAAIGAIRIRSGAVGNPEVAVARTSTGSSAENPAYAKRVLALSPGAYSFYVTFERLTGTGTASLGATSTSPAYLLPEDLGQIPAT